MSFPDGLFWKSVQNTFIYVVFTVFMTLILGFVLALALNSAALWGTRFFQRLYLSSIRHIHGFNVDGLALAV